MLDVLSLFKYGNGKSEQSAIKALICSIFVALLGGFWAPEAFSQIDNQVKPIQMSPAAKANMILPKVAAALKQTSYKGRITYEQGGKLEVMEVSHAVLDGGEYEKVLFLNGDELELIQPRHGIDCASIGDSLFHGLGNADTSKLTGLAAVYNVALVGEDRVAGREAWVIQMMPKDEFRFGMIVTVDKKSYLPLKSMYVSGGRKVLERMHFVSLETDVPFTKEEFEGYAQASTECPEASVQGARQVWQPSWIPHGFHLSGYSRSAEDGFMHTYTDGLSSFSLFVKPLASAEDAPMGGVSTNLRKGATAIMLRKVVSGSASYQVSLLGEIPMTTAGRVLASLGR